MLDRVSRDEEARSTDRPPAPEDDSHPDIAGAIQRAKTNASPGRYGPPAATAKIGKFELAEALARTTAEGESIPTSSRPPRDDDAPFVPGEVEVVGEEEVNSPISGAPSNAPDLDSLPPAKAKTRPLEALTSTKASEGNSAATTAVVPKKSGGIGLVLLGVLIGAVVITYVYIRTR